MLGHAGAAKSDHNEGRGGGAQSFVRFLQESRERKQPEGAWMMPRLGVIAVLAMSADWPIIFFGWIPFLLSWVRWLFTGQWQARRFTRDHAFKPESPHRSLDGTHERA